MIRKCLFLFVSFGLFACDSAPPAPAEPPAEAPPAEAKPAEVKPAEAAVERPAPTEAPARVEDAPPAEVKKPSWEDKRLHEVIGAAARAEIKVFDPARKETRRGEIKDKAQLQALLDAIDLGQELKPTAVPRCIHGVTATFFDAREQPLGAVAVCAGGGPLLDGAEAVFIEPGSDVAATSARLYRAGLIGEMALKVATELVQPAAPAPADPAPVDPAPAAP
jgi:hypothetical protein